MATVQGQDLLNNNHVLYSNYETLKKTTEAKRDDKRMDFSSNSDGWPAKKSGQQARKKPERTQTLPCTGTPPNLQRIRRSHTINNVGSPLLHHRLQRILSAQNLDTWKDMSRDRNLSQSQTFDIYEQMRSLCTSTGDLTDIIKDHLDRSETFVSTPSPRRRKKKHYYDTPDGATACGESALRGQPKGCKDDDFDIEDGFEIFIDYHPVVDKACVGKKPPKIRPGRPKMASNRNHNYGNDPPEPSSADSQNNNPPAADTSPPGKTQSQTSPDADGTLSTCSTLGRYSTLERLVRTGDHTVTNSDFEDLCAANDLESDTDTLTGSPRQFGTHCAEGNGAKSRTHGETDFLAQLGELMRGPEFETIQATSRDPEPELKITNVQDTIGQLNFDYLTKIGLDVEPEIEMSETHDTIGQINTGYLKTIGSVGSNGSNGAMNLNRFETRESENRAITISPLPVKDTSPNGSPLMRTRRASGSIMDKVTAFENLQRRRSGLEVKDASEFKIYDDTTEYRKVPLDRACIPKQKIIDVTNEEDDLREEVDKNIPVRDAISIFEKFNDRRNVPENPITNLDLTVKGDVSPRPVLRPQQAFEKSFDLDSQISEFDKQKELPRTPRKSRKEFGEVPKRDAPPSAGKDLPESRGRIKYRSSSADRYTDPNRRNAQYRARDVSPRFSPQNAGDPKEERKKLKYRSSSGDRVRTASAEYRQEERPHRAVLPEQAKPKESGRSSREEKRRQQRHQDQKQKHFEEIDNLAPLPPRDDGKRRSGGYDRHPDFQTKQLSPLPEQNIGSGYYDSPYLPRPVYDHRRRSGSYERVPERLMGSPQPPARERTSGSYERPAGEVILSPQVPYPDLKRWSGNYDRYAERRPEVPHHVQGPPPVPIPPRQYGRDYMLPPYGPDFPEGRNSPRYVEGYHSPYMERGPGSPRCFSPQQRHSYHERDSSPRCFSPRQWLYQERDRMGSPHGYSPRDRYYQNPEEDPIYARVYKSGRPYFGPPKPGTYYIHDRPENWWPRNYEDGYYDAHRYAPPVPPPPGFYDYHDYRGYPGDYPRLPQDNPHRSWEHQDRQYPVNQPYSPPTNHYNYTPDPRGYPPNDPKPYPHERSPYDNVNDAPAPSRHFGSHLRVTSPTGYHSDDPMYLRKMNEYLNRKPEQIHHRGVSPPQPAQPVKNFYSDFHPGDPCGPSGREKPKEWKYGEEIIPTRPPETFEQSAFHRYNPDDPDALLNPVNQPLDEQPASFDSGRLPSYSDLPEQEAVQSQDPIDQYMSPPRQMKLKPKRVKKDKEKNETKPVTPIPIRPYMPNKDETDTMRSASTTTSTLKSFATDTIGSSMSWGRYDPFINPTAFAPEIGTELIPNLNRGDRDRTPTRSGPAPQRSLSDPSETDKGHETRPHSRSRTGPSAVPNVLVNSPSPAGDKHKGGALNRDVWVQLEARHPLRVPPASVASTNLNKIEIESSVAPSKIDTPPSKGDDWQYNRVYGVGKETGDKQSERQEPHAQKDILAEKGVIFHKPDTSGVKKNFDEILSHDLSKRKLIYKKSHSDTKIRPRISLKIRAERPTTLNIQEEFPKPDADIKGATGARDINIRKQLTDSIIAVRSDEGDSVKHELRELSRTRGSKIAGIKSAMFSSCGKKEAIIHPIPLKSTSLSNSSYSGSFQSSSQDPHTDEYLIHIAKEDKVKKKPVIEDHLAELEGLFQELDLDNEELMTNAARREATANLQVAIEKLGNVTSDISFDSVRNLPKSPEESMPSLEYARLWLAEENERILSEAAALESMLDATLCTSSDDVFTEKPSENRGLLGVDSPGRWYKQSDSSSVISDTKSAPGGSTNTRPLFPRRIADDMNNRKVARSNSSSSVPALPPISPVSFLSFTPGLSPATSAECLARRRRSMSKTPDIVFDDINFRKIQRSVSQPGVDCHDIRAKPSPTTADYLLNRTSEPQRARMRRRAERTADKFHDDLAYRNLRKDIPPVKTVISLKQRSRSLECLPGQRSIEVHHRPPDGKSSARPAEFKPARRTSLSKGVSNIVDIFEVGNAPRPTMRQTHSLPDLSYCSEFSVTFDDRGNVISSDPRFCQHARRPKRTPRLVKMKSRLRQKHSDESETCSSEKSDSYSPRLHSKFYIDSDGPGSDGALSGSEDARHEFEVTRSSLHDSETRSDYDNANTFDHVQQTRPLFDKYKTSPVLEPEVFNPRKQSRENIKDWYKTHQDSFEKVVSYFETNGQNGAGATSGRLRLNLYKSASQDDITARSEKQSCHRLYPREADYYSDMKPQTTSLKISYGSDPCLAEGRSQPPKHSDHLNQFRSILHFTAPTKHV